MYAEESVSPLITIFELIDVYVFPKLSLYKKNVDLGPGFLSVGSYPVNERLII